MLSPSSLFCPSIIIFGTHLTRHNRSRTLDYNQPELVGSCEIVYVEAMLLKDGGWGGSGIAVGHPVKAITATEMHKMFGEEKRDRERARANGETIYLNNMYAYSPIYGLCILMLRMWLCVWVYTNCWCTHRAVMLLVEKKPQRTKDEKMP